jgi:hypothetical protein
LDAQRYCPTPHRQCILHQHPAPPNAAALPLLSHSSMATCSLARPSLTDTVPPALDRLPRFPSSSTVALAQMVVTIVVLRVAKAAGAVQFPDLSVAVMRKVRACGGASATASHACSPLGSAMRSWAVIMPLTCAHGNVTCCRVLLLFPGVSSSVDLPREYGHGALRDKGVVAPNVHCAATVLHPLHTAGRGQCARLNTPHVNTALGDIATTTLRDRSKASTRSHNPRTSSERCESPAVASAVGSLLTIAPLNGSPSATSADLFAQQQASYGREAQCLYNAHGRADRRR